MFLYELVEELLQTLDQRAEIAYNFPTSFSSPYVKVMTVNILNLTSYKLFHWTTTKSYL